MMDKSSNKHSSEPHVAVTRIGKSQTYTIQVFAAAPEGGERLQYANQVQISSLQVRLKIVEDLCDRFGFEPTALERHFLDQMADKGDGDSTAHSVGKTVTIDPSGHFDTSVAAVAVPRQSGGAVKWELCIQHQGGLREVVPISSPNLGLQDGTRVLVDPLPDGDGNESAWSPDRRAAWLQGGPPPDPTGLVAGLAQEVSRYVRFPGGDETHETWCLVIAVFTFFTYVYRASPTSPYLRITGPTGSGKTRTLEVLHQVGFRPVISCSMTAATLFRVIDLCGGLVLIDEAEHLANSSNGSTGILPILLSGYKQNGTVHRTIGDRVRRYRTFGPKAYAAIEESHPTLVNRSINVRMFRDNTRNADRLIDESAEVWAEIRNGFQEIALTYGCEWPTQLREDRDWGIAGRNREVWGPLLRLSAWLDGHGGSGELEERLADHARNVIAEVQVELIPAVDQTLLQTLSHRLRELNDAGDKIVLADCPRPGDILRLAKRDDPVAFSHISAHRVAAILKRYGLRTHQGNQHVYVPDCLHQLQQIEQAYGIHLGLQRGAKEADDEASEY